MWPKPFFPEIFFVVNYGFSFLGKFPLTIFQFPAFLGIGSLFFADFWHKGAKWQCPKSEGARFSRKKIFPAENAGNMPENRVFGHFLEISSLFFSHFLLKGAY